MSLQTIEMKEEEMNLLIANRLQQLRKENGYSQEQLAELVGLSRQSISKWEQGISTPDTDNLIKLSEIYNVPLEYLIKGEEAKIEQPKEDKKEKKTKKKRSWIFPAYPIIMVIIYTIIGAIFGVNGWVFGWIILLTIPLFYTTIIAYEKKKPIIFCYPIIPLIIFLIGGLVFNIWHPLWIVFLTIPLFYIITAKHK
jgi:transcriptional regulator with XRE-family HTH domain